MTASERIKVDKGNQIARLCAEVLDFCRRRSIVASVENPSGPFLWDTPAFQALLPKRVRVDFDACMHGADRDKRTTLLCSDDTFVPMRKKCDRSRSHKPWGVDVHSATLFRTAEECEYPARMCQSMASLAARRLRCPTPQTAEGQGRPKKVRSISKPDLEAAARRAQVGVQSKRVLRGDAVPERQPPKWTLLPDPVRTEKAFAWACREPSRGMERSEGSS